MTKYKYTRDQTIINQETGEILLDLQEYNFRISTKQDLSKLKHKFQFKTRKKKNPFHPKKYYSNLSLQAKKKRSKEFNTRKKKSSKDASAYKTFETDFKYNKRIKTKLSNYTKQWRSYFPNAKSLRQKSDMSGVPLSILKKVFDKGLAAWRTGHRPGANGQQWAYARVHSFLVKGKTFYTADRKLAEEAIQKSKKAKAWFNSIQGLCDYKSKNPKWCK